MRNNRFFLLLVMCFALLASGCATRGPVALDPSFWTQRNVPIAVATTGVPKPSAQKTGQQGLLDIAINNGMAGPLEKKLVTADVSRAAKIPENFASQLQARGFNATLLSDPIDLQKLEKFKDNAHPNDFADRDFRKIDAHGAERLLLIQVNALGTTRAYYGFMPLGAPQAFFSAHGMLIDLKTNKLLWDSNTASTLPVTGPWDQAPDYANLMNAVTDNIEKGASNFEASFLTPSMPQGAAPAAASNAAPVSGSNGAETQSSPKTSS